MLSWKQGHATSVLIIPCIFCLVSIRGLTRASSSLALNTAFLIQRGSWWKNWVSGFHLGYTQRSVWDLKNESKPFDDTSYPNSQPLCEYRKDHTDPRHSVQNVRSFINRPWIRLFWTKAMRSFIRKKIITRYISVKFRIVIRLNNPENIAD